MARAEKHILKTLEEAVAELKGDPSSPVRLVVDGVEFEVRRPAEAGVAPGPVDQSNLGDRIASLGPWQGETSEEILRIIRAGRESQGKALPDLR